MSADARVKFELTGHAGNPVTGEIIVHEHGSGVEIHLDGFGTKTFDADLGSTVWLEKYDGKVQLLVWPDINEEDPQVISLEGARVESYEEDDDETGT